MQQLLNLLDLVAGSAGWDADMATNFSALKAALRTWKGTIQTQGNISTPSEIRFQLQDANGNNVSEQVYLRVRLTDNSGYAVATNGVIAAVSGTTLVETLTTDKDLVFQSDSAGLVKISYTNGNAVTRILRLAPATIQPAFANHNNSQSITHA